MVMLSNRTSGKSVILLGSKCVSAARSFSHGMGTLSTSGGSTQDPPGYYINYLTGNDSNDGKTHLTAWKHGPGDPNAGGSVATFAPPAGTTIYWEGNQDHFLASYSGQITFCKPQNGGSSSTNRVIHTTRPGSGGGLNARWRGDEPNNTGWVSASSDPLLGAAGAKSIAEKLTPATPAPFFQTFITAGTQRLYAAQYPTPNNASMWENDDSGSNSYTQLTSWGSNVSWSGTSGTIIDPTYYARYGNGGLVGYVIAYRTSGNGIEEDIILTGPDSTGKITWTGTTSPITAGGQNDFFYCIRYHPRDLELPGQYAWTTDLKTVYGTFGSTYPGSRGITRLKRILDITNQSHLTIDSIDMMYTSAPVSTPNNDAGIAIYGSGGTTIDDLIVNNCNIYAFQCPARSPAINFLGNFGQTIGVQFTNVTVDDTQGRGISLATSGNYVKATVTNFTATRIGRTVDYTQFGAYSSSDPQHVCLHQYVRGSNCTTFHGNGLTTYVETHNCDLFNFEFMNHTAPVTTQTSVTGYTRNNHWKGGIASGRRTKPGVRPGTSTPWQPNTANCSRFDGGETGSLVEQYISVYTFGGNGFDLKQIPTGAFDTGMIIRNAIIDSFACTTGVNAFQGITLENVLILGPGFPITSVATITSNGGTIAGSSVSLLTGNFTYTGSISGTTLTTTSTPSIPLVKCMPVSGTGVAFGTTIVQQLTSTTFQVNISQTVSSTTLTSSTLWNGIITSQMQQYLTRISDGTGANPNYQSIVMGLAWNVPAYGTSYSLTDVDIDNYTVCNNWPADEAFASVVNITIDSVLDLPVGSGNNNLFYLDHGQVFFVSNASAGTYSLVIRQTNLGNAHLTGSTTHLTTIPITVTNV